MKRPGKREIERRQSGDESEKLEEPESYRVTGLSRHNLVSPKTGRRSNQDSLETANGFGIETRYFYSAGCVCHPEDWSS
jgi:hypothetical protein